MRLTDLIKSKADCQEQYRDAANLNARGAIYKYGDPKATPWPRWVFEQLALPADARVLELGCGSGVLWKKNIERIPPEWHIVLTDQSAGMLAEAGQPLATDPRFQFLRMDAHEFAFPSESFDAVVANHMLYHVDDRPRALAEIRRVLKPGGALYAATNSEAHMQRMKELIFRFVGHDEPILEAMPFGVENGGEQLAPFFPRIEMRPVNGELRVTDVEAVVAYVMSMNTAPQRLRGERLGEMRRTIQMEINERGAFICQTRAGLFVVHK